MMFDPRQMAAMMKQMGIKTNKIDAAKVVIEKNDGSKIIIENPDVNEVNMQGMKTYQIAGNIREENTGEDKGSSDEDIELIMESAKVDRETATKALEKNNGDIANAIISLTGDDEKSD